MSWECGHVVAYCPLCGSTAVEKPPETGAKPDAKSGANGSASLADAHVFDSGSKPEPTTAPKRQQYTDPWFQAFWKEYPRKIGKKPAQKAWDNCIKSGAHPSAIIDAAKAYAAAAKRHGIDKRYLKYPQGWLNDERFNDEPETVSMVPPDQIVGTPEWMARVEAEEERAIAALREDA